MKKLLILLSLLVLAVFVVSCAPKEGAEEGVPVELEKGALAGQAIRQDLKKAISCADSDGGKVPETKGAISLVFPDGSSQVVEDKCKGNSLQEYYCTTNKGYAKSFSCPDGCKNGACVKTCTLGPIGSSKCVIKVFPNYNNNAMIASIKEYQYANCSTYFGNNDGLNNNENFSVCGWNKDQTKLAGLCQDNKGCCNAEIPLSANYCDGNILTNTSKNVCTGEEKVNQLDCSTWLHVDGTPKICMQDSKGGFFCGVTSCTLGEKIFTCNDQKDYITYTCLGDEFDKSFVNPTWGPTNSGSGCPSGKKCQFFNGKNYGLCT